MRQIVLDTETTGLEVDMGHRIIEIGAVEVINRKQTGRHFHKYINPQREIDDGAFEVHGISQDFLADKPVFEQIWEEFVAFVSGAELVIHNATFDVEFINYEFKKIAAAPASVADICSITDSLAVARHKHPGQKNNLDALCRRYEVDNSQRQLHGALLDAEILADVYLLMTGGQTQLFGSADQGKGNIAANVMASIIPVDQAQFDLKVVSASGSELDAHEQYLDYLGESSGDVAVWRQE